jgi:hypothetical protein
MGYDCHECHVLNGRAMTILRILINLLKYHHKRNSVIISKFSQNIVNLSNTNWIDPSPGAFTGFLRDFLRSIAFICVSHWNIRWNTVFRRVSRKEHTQWNKTPIFRENACQVSNDSDSYFKSYKRLLYFSDLFFTLYIVLTI